MQEFSTNLVNELGNLPRPGVVPKFSDLEVIALNLTAENMSIDSENYLFALLEDYRDEMPNLISRRQYNDRRKYTADLCERIRKRIVERIDGSEDIGFHALVKLDLVLVILEVLHTRVEHFMRCFGGDSFLRPDQSQRA